MSRKKSFKEKLSITLSDNTYLNKKAISMKKSFEEVKGMLGTKRKK